MNPTLPLSNASVVDVSIVAANYNNAAFLTEFFDSWENSRVWPKELLFVDDGSSDESMSIAANYSGRLPFLILIALPANVGFGNALNEGIARATGKYILRIDPDDATLPERLNLQCAVLDSDVADVVGSNAYIFQHPSARKIGLTNFPQDHEEIDKVIRRGEHGVLHPTVMARAELFKTHVYVQESVPAEDYDIFARMLAAGARFYNIQQPLLRYRIHQRSASNILPFSTIEKTYRIRDKVFGTHTSRLEVAIYYLHIKFYRKYLFSTGRVSRTGYLGLASMLRPDKALKRLLRGITARTER